VATESVATATSSSDIDSGASISCETGTTQRSAHAPWQSAPMHSRCLHSTALPLRQRSHSPQVISGTIATRVPGAGPSVPGPSAST
jgi:hypothetical protein